MSQFTKNVEQPLIDKDYVEVDESKISFDDFKEKSVEKSTRELIEKMKKRKNEKI